jgi:L-Ala-D/L-Glu epimerase
MLIKKVDIWHLNCRFQYPFKHKLATHTASENLVVRLTTDQGICGYGEGIPRDFVTGESLGASLTFLKEDLGSAVLRIPINSPKSLFPSLTLLQEKWASNTSPGAFCALEMALLDAAGRTWEQPVSAFLWRQVGGPGDLQRGFASRRRPPVDPVFAVSAGSRDAFYQTQGGGGQRP